jgi:hypothetical protein
MGATDYIKSLFDSVDKITDILNVGRLLFYGTAGLIFMLPIAMTLRLLAHGHLDTYWAQFLSDLWACGRHPAVWFGALVMGFVISAVANAIVMDKLTPVPKGKIHKDYYDYQYSRLFNGGMRPKDGASKDYAAWLISEYYRYVEIVIFIPYAVLLALPVCSFYSLVYLIRTAGQPEGFVLHASHYAFALWTLAWVTSAVFVWPEFWFPRVAQPTYEGWVLSRREAIAGLKAFMDETNPAAKPAAQPPAKPSAQPPDHPAQEAS